MNLEQLFARCVPIPDTGCWLWAGSCDTPGYGQCRVAGRSLGAHRAAWAFAHGPIPAGLWVLHRCDTPACCNPAHLFLGTSLDNVRDRDAKGRTARGSRNGTQTHPERRARGERNGTHTQPTRRPRGERNGRARLTADQVAQIRAQCAAGVVTGADLARAYGVSRTSIRRITRGDNWQEAGHGA